VAHGLEQTFGFIPKSYFWFNTKSVRSMNFSGHQLRAARALLGLDQEALAKKVGVSDNTIRNMEACGPQPVGGFVSTREKVREGLEGLGIEFSNGDAPGVRLRKGTGRSRLRVEPPKSDK
jgi:transcriptional regulator with XRE-family HTH domain